GGGVIKAEDARGAARRLANQGRQRRNRRQANHGDRGTMRSRERGANRGGGRRGQSRGGACYPRGSVQAADVAVLVSGDGRRGAGVARARRAAGGVAGGDRNYGSARYRFGRRA